MSLVEVSVGRLVFAYITSFFVQAVIVNQGAKYSSVRAYYLLGEVIRAAAFFLSLIFVAPVVIP